MRFFRQAWWSRRVAIVLLIAALPGLSHLAADDVACVSPVEGAEAHDETQHGLRPAESQHHQDHCAICHWSRSLRSPRSSAAVLARLLSPAATVPVTEESSEWMLALDRAPARAPPSVAL